MWKLKKNSLNLEIWKYFLLFSSLILGFLWIFQVLFLNNYYRLEKTKDIKLVANTIKKNNQSSISYNSLNNVALEKEVCVEIIDKNLFSIYSSTYFGKGCISNKKLTSNYKIDFINSNVREKSYELVNEEFDSNNLVYALKINNNAYAFINTSLEPITSTAKILRKQLILVTFLVLILSFIIAYFISSYISKPIVKINNAAKKLANKEYNVEFTSDSNILELEELSKTLNYTSSELAKTEELRRDLMANVSHDLKTPLTLIKAYAEMTRDIHAGNKEKNTENMNTIIAETDRLTVLVNDILELSKVQSNIDTLKSEEFNLISMIEDILKRYRILEETEEYHFLFNHKKKKILIKADQKKLEQVIYNLINNAINYTGTDKTVTINIIESKETIKVEIIDTGKGIAEEDIPYIWDKYYKDKKKHKRNVIGTGLGLSIVKNILENHNFEYGVTSKKDKGSNFYFKIPKEM